MVVKRITYSREFSCETIGVHKIKNKEDADLREEIVKTFSIQEKEGSFLGYDGKTMYCFRIDQNGMNHSLSEQLTYQTMIHVTKAGSSEENNRICDLEKFLLEKQFIGHMD